METAPTLPPTYLLLRQPGRLAEVVLIKAGQPDEVLFTGKRWAARNALLSIRATAAYRDLPVYCRKDSGTMIEMTALAV
jgi:hypothetical protein